MINLDHTVNYKALLIKQGKQTRSQAMTSWLMRLLSVRGTALKETAPLASTLEETTLCNCDLLSNVSEPNLYSSFCLKTVFCLGLENLPIPHKQNCHFSCKLKIGSSNQNAYMNTLCIFKMPRNAVVNPILFPPTVHRNIYMLWNTVLELTTNVLENSCITP